MIDLLLTVALVVGLFLGAVILTLLLALAIMFITKGEGLDGSGDMWPPTY